tara:strand:- start:1030 stop:1299 length:270 start_codon:yes stop_codon:yes gene_type:complete
MTTSQNNTRLIEKYLNGRLSPADRFLFESRLIIDPVLKRDLFFQEKTLRLIKMYHREKLKEELETLHQQMFNNPDKINFRQSIYQLFKR